MNSVPSTLVDQWIAYYSLKYEEERDQLDKIKSKHGGKKDSQSALESLKGKANGSRN